MVRIEFTRDELANELLAMQHEVISGQADPDLLSLVNLAMGQYDEVVSAEVSEGDIDEEQAIGFEQFRSGIAAAVHEAAKAQMGNTPQVILLGRQTETPRLDSKKKAEEVAHNSERKVNADRVLKEIASTEAKHAVSSQMLRQNKYIDPTSKPNERNGAWLARKLEEIVDNGSNMAVFSSQEAKIIAGNALVKKSHAEIVQIKHDLEHLANLHERARFLGARAEPGLFSGVSKLKELAETGALEKRADLKEVRNFVELIQAPVEDVFERVAAALDEGPFADCPELDTTPFPTENERGGKRSLKEIPTDDVTEDNILDDIQNAVNASGATEYIIEEERVTEFVGLKKHLENKYPGQISIFRSLSSNWHPLPWYVIQITPPGEAPMAVLESPLYGNASYYINNGDWRGTIDFKRRDAQQLGARPLVHAIAEGQTLAMHTNKIKAVVEAGY